MYIEDTKGTEDTSWILITQEHLFTSAVVEIKQHLYTERCEGDAAP